MNRSALAAFATLGAFAFASVAMAADEPSTTAATAVSVDPNHAFAMRFHLDPDARKACGVDTNQHRMPMRIWWRQHECLRDYFSGTLR